MLLCHKKLTALETNINLINEKNLNINPKQTNLKYEYERSKYIQMLILYLSHNKYLILG